VEGLPEPASEACTSGAYAKKHNPFAYFPKPTAPTWCPQRASRRTYRRAACRVPVLRPNLINDGHDGSNEQVDNYLKSLIPSVLASTWYQESGIVMITWDESNGEGKIPTL